MADEKPRLNSLYDRLLKDYESIGERQASGCLLWNHDCCDRRPNNSMRGYGRIRVGAKKAMVTRVIYHHYVDAELPIWSEDRKWIIDHRCRVTNCFEPSHLQLETARTNVELGALCDLNPNKSSKYMGVRKARFGNKFVATIIHNGKPVYLGSFPSEQDASEAYQRSRANYESR